MWYFLSIPGENNYNYTSTVHAKNICLLRTFLFIFMPKICHGNLGEFALRWEATTAIILGVKVPKDWSVCCHWALFVASRKYIHPF